MENCNCQKSRQLGVWRVLALFFIAATVTLGLYSYTKYQETNRLLEKNLELELINETLAEDFEAISDAGTTAQEASEEYKTVIDAFVEEIKKQRAKNDSISISLQIKTNKNPKVTTVDDDDKPGEKQKE